MGQILGLLRIIASVFTLLSGQQKIDVGRGQINLKDTQIEDLSKVIATKHMTTIAIKYLGLPYETVENLKRDNKDNSVAFNRDLLILWRNKNPGTNQVQVS